MQDSHTEEEPEKDSSEREVSYRDAGLHAAKLSEAIEGETPDTLQYGMDSAHVPLALGVNVYEVVTFIRFALLFVWAHVLEQIRSIISASPRHSPVVQPGLHAEVLADTTANEFLEDTTPLEVLVDAAPPEFLADAAALDDIIVQHREALSEARHTRSGPAVHHASRLADCILVRYKRYGSLNDLEEQVSLREEILGLVDDNNVPRARALCDLAETLRARSEPLGQLEDLQRAVGLFEEALQLCPEGHPDRDTCLDGLGCSLRTRHRERGNADDLNSAVTHLENALKLRPPDHPRRHQTLHNLANAFLSIFMTSGDLDVLEQCIPLGREALRLRVDSHPDREESLSALSCAVGTRFHHRGDLKDLTESISFLEELVKLCAPCHPWRSKYLSNLATVYLDRTRYSGEVGDLDGAIKALRESLEICKRGAIRPYVLYNLGRTLRVRFGQFKDPQDLEDAISAQSQVQDLVDPGHPLRGHAMGGMAEGYCDRFLYAEGDRQDLDRAVDVSQQALGLEQSGHSAKTDILDTVARSLLLRYSHCSRALDDVNGAIDTYQRSLALLDGDSMYHAAILDGLAEAFRMRFSASGDFKDALAAMEHQQKTLDELDVGRALRSECLTHRARLYLTPSAPFFDVDAGLRDLSDALEDPHRNPQLRLEDSLLVLSEKTDWMQGNDAANGIREQLLQVHRLMVHLLPSVAYLGLDIKSRLRVLSKAESVASSGAGHALLLSRAHIAVELLEEGRAIFWTQALRLRTPFDELPEKLSVKLVSLSRQLEKDSHVLPGSQKAVDELTRRRQQSAQFDEVLEDVRAQPGLERFMLPETYSSLSRAGDDGPVVVLVASPITCQAIIIRGRDLDALQVPLVDVTTDKLRALDLIIKADNVRLRDGDEEERGMRVISSEGAQSFKVLEELWRTIVKPVFEAIGLEKNTGSARPRMWWCPTGAFTFLPLHAAGVYRGEVDCCSDYVVSSYTPTLGALLNARRNRAPHPSAQGIPTILLAAVPRPSGWKPLPFVAEELSGIQDVVPSAAIIPLPDAEDCTQNPAFGTTVRTIVDKLPEAAILHLACHGHQVEGDPLMSGFVLQDKMLTLAKLMELKLPRASFAFLSACETAKGDHERPDQTLHLAAAIMFAGFRSVVGTMWTMGDPDGPVVAKAVYKALFKNSVVNTDAVPYALDEATRKLRLNGAPPNRWATYIHLGA